MTVTAANSMLEPDSSHPGRELRFSFGSNWRRFLGHLNEERIGEAEKSLRSMLQVENLKGKSFLDIGCGSGLFSLAAMRLGASRVHSFDYDSESVACAQELRRRYFPAARNWSVEQGSVLDVNYLHDLGKFDVVYSWGVLHHTGSMWRALENVAPLVAAGGRVFLAIYNDQGGRSQIWRSVKERYCRSIFWRVPILAVFCGYIVAVGVLKDVLLLRKNLLARYRQYKSNRGMSYFTDVVDWLGGYPYEYARREAIVDFYRDRGYELLKLKPDLRFGNNEFVFLKRDFLL